MSEKFISYDNLKQYDEFLDQELQDIKQHIDEGFTYNVKYAESDEIGGAALKAISDENNENIAEHFSNNENDIIVNRTTLGYQKKNLFNPNTVNWYQPTKVSIASDGTIVSTSTSDARSWSLENAEYFLTLSPGEYSIKAITETIDNTISSQENIRGYNESGTQIFDIYPNATGVKSASFTLTETTTVAIMFKLFTQTCKIMIYNANIKDTTYESYKPTVEEYITKNKNSIIINKTTLGYQKKNLFDWGKATWLNPNGSITVTKTDTDISVTSKNSWASATYRLPELEIGRKYTFSVLVSDLVKDSAAEANRVKIRLSYDSGGQTPVQDFNLENDGNYKMTFTSISDTVYVIFYPNYSSNVLTNSFTASEIMLRYADITDDTYEPYIGSVNERLQNCLLLSGGTMDDDAKIKIAYSKDGRYAQYGNTIKMVAPNGGWAAGISYYGYDGTSLLGSYGAYGNATTLNYHYIGGAFDNPLFKLDAEGNANFIGSVSATNFSGNASSATKLANSRTIDGVSFNGSTAIHHYGTCSTPSATAAKDVKLPGFSLVTGAKITVVFSNSNTEDAVTLNVNNTGAKPVFYLGAPMTHRLLKLSRNIGNDFVYDGTNWIYCGQSSYVSQANSTSNSDFRLLLSQHPDDEQDRAGTYKSSKFTANPSTGVMTATTFKSNGSNLLSSGIIKWTGTDGELTENYIDIALSTISNYSSVVLRIYSEMYFNCLVIIPIQYMIKESVTKLRVPCYFKMSGVLQPLHMPVTVISGTGLRIYCPSDTSGKIYGNNKNYDYEIFKI